MNQRYATCAAVMAMLVIFSANADAQGVVVKAGVKGGMNFSSLRGDDIDLLEEQLQVGIGTRVGFAAGGFVSISPHQMFAIQPEFLVFSQKGSSSDLGGVDFHFILDYFDVPILAKLMVPTQSTVTPNFFAGPALSFNLRSKLKAEGGGQSAEIDLDEAGLDTKAVDFGFVFGGGLDIDTGMSTLTFDVRYTLGLTKVWKFQGLAEDVDARNGAFSFMVGYSFI